MDNGTLVSKINNVAAGAVLDGRPFGRFKVLSIWIQARTIRDVAKILKEDSETKFNWLENISAMHMDDALVLTYFLRSSHTGFTDNRLILRISAVPASCLSEVELPSVTDTWPMARAMEQEAGEMFGIRFTEDSAKVGLSDASGTKRSRKGERLPGTVKGYPLRKDYVSPNITGLKERE